MKWFKTLAGAFFGVVLVTSVAVAQGGQMQQPEPVDPGSIEDEELVMYVKVTNQAGDIQTEAEEKMAEEVENEGIEMERFQEIMMSMQNPQMAEEAEITEEEREAIQNLQPKIMQINQEAQGQFMQVIQEEGLTVQRFQQIFQSAQAHPELMEKIEEIRTEMEEEG